MTLKRASILLVVAAASVVTLSACATLQRGQP